MQNSDKNEEKPVEDEEEDYKKDFENSAELNSPNKNEEGKEGKKAKKKSTKAKDKEGKEKKKKTKDATPELTLEQKIKNSQEIISKLREENDELRNQLKGLCTYLSKELEKKKISKNNSSNDDDDPQKLKSFYEKTIENNEKQKGYYLKKIESYKARANDDTPPPQRIDDLLSKIKTKEDEILAASLKVKELEAANRILAKEELNAKNATDFMKNLNLLTVEINALRGKSDKIKKQLTIDEKNFKKQQEFVTKLQIKYTELCNSFQLNPDLEKIKEEIEENNKKNLLELQKFNKELKNIRKNSKQDFTPQFMLEDLLRLKTEPVVKKKRYGSVKEYKEDNKDDVLENFDKNPAKAEKQFLNLRSRIKTMRKIVANEEKTMQKGLEEIKNKTVDLEFENKEIEHKIKEKEKELVMANEIFKEMKKTTKFNALAPLNYSMTQIKEEKGKELKEMEDFTNKSLIIRNSDARKRKTKRDSCGAILSYDVVFFDDVQAIGSCKKHQLKKITFFLDKKNIIVGLQATYIKHNEIYLGYKNLMASTSQEPDLQEKTFELADDDYIRNVYGLYVDWIEYLRFETEKHEIFEVGVINEKENPKEFSLNIRNFDIPVTIFGALDLKKGGNSNEYVLAAIGVEMKNELTERNEARSKEKLSKSQIAKDLLNLSNSTGRGTSSSLDHKKKNKRYHLKKPGEMIILEENGKKTKKTAVSTEKSLSLEKKKPQKSKTRFSDNEESEENQKKGLKGKKNDFDNDEEKKNKKNENPKGNKKDDSDDEKKKKNANNEENSKKPALKAEEEKKNDKNKKEEKKKEEKKKK